jgi:hypothetical protein
MTDLTLSDAIGIGAMWTPHVCSVGALIVHLNDSHRWTRERIAAWVAEIEAAVPVADAVYA